MKNAAAPSTTSEAPMTSSAVLSAAAAFSADARGRSKVSRGSWNSGAPSATLVTFVMENIHAHDVGTILDSEGVAVRTGHHCCQPLMGRFGITGTLRASFACFNDSNDVQRLAEAVEKSALLLR